MRDGGRPCRVLPWAIALAAATSLSTAGCTAPGLPATATASSAPAPATVDPTSASVTTPSVTASASATPTTTSAKPTTTRTTTTAPSSGPISTSGALAGMVAAAGANGRPSTGGARLKPTASGPLSGKVIVVDPGHNGNYVSSILTRQVPAGHGTTKACNASGTVSAGGVGEHAINWDVGVRLVTLLRAKGATVVLTRPSGGGVGPCVNERAAIANRADADLVLSIHGDGNMSSSARGFHVITSTTMDGGSGLEARSAALAGRLVTTMRRNTDLPVSNYIGGGTGISRRSDIAGLNLLTHSPGIMLEMGNLRQSSDWAYLKTDSGKSGVARALAEAALATLG